MEIQPEEEEGCPCSLAILYSVPSSLTFYQLLKVELGRQRNKVLQVDFFFFFFSLFIKNRWSARLWK
jgi:hypothetical protein